MYLLKKLKPRLKTAFIKIVLSTTKKSVRIIIFNQIHKTNLEF